MAGVRSAFRPRKLLYTSLSLCEAMRIMGSLVELETLDAEDSGLDFSACLSEIRKHSSLYSSSDIDTYRSGFIAEGDV
jgi:hypothetical protein